MSLGLKRWGWAAFSAIVLASCGVSAGQATLPAGAADGQAGAGKAGAPEGADLTKLSLEDLMNVQVTSVSKKQQSIASAPAAIYVISQEDIRRSSYTTIPDLLRMAPGVDVGQINPYTWAIGVRGINSEFTNNLLVLQDGRSLYNPIYGGVYWDTVDYVLEDIDRIEVIRGPGATLWGANAVNGVINITSKDSRDTQGWLISGLGSNVDSSVSARYGGKISDDTTYRVYAKGKYTDQFERSDGIDADDQWSREQAGFRIDKRPSDDDTLTLQGDAGRSQLSQPQLTPTFTAPFSVLGVQNRYDDTGNVLARWTHKFDEGSDFALQAYLDYLSVTSDDIGADATTADLDFHHRFQLGSANEVTWGLGYRYINSTIKPMELVGSATPTRDDKLLSTFVQDTLTVVPDRWFVTVGSKFEHNGYTGFEFEPGARVLWTPNRQNSVWAAVSRAVRTPTRVDHDIQVTLQRGMVPDGSGGTSPFEVDVRGRDSASEHLLAYELGYRFEPTRSFSVDIAGFYNRYDSLQSVTVGAIQPGSPAIQPIYLDHRNEGSGQTWGTEIAATVVLSDQWRMTGSYSLLMSEIDGRTDFSSPVAASSLDDSAPQQQAQIRSYYDITRSLQLNAGLYYVDQVAGYRVPGYVTGDVNLIWMPAEGMELKAGVRNIFDNRRPEYGVEGIQGIASEAPTTFFVQWSYRF